MKKIVFAFIGIFALWKIFTDPGITELVKPESTSPKKDPHPGIVNLDPQQVKIAKSSKVKIGDYTINELYQFRIRARILAKKNYSTDRESQLLKTDLALGWGRMSDLKVLEKISVSQRNRWYFWQTPQFPIPRREIETHSANMHLIPASDAIQTQIDKTQEGDIIEITGSLVRAESNKDNWRWQSSTSRTDTGGGACEVILVKELKIAGEPDKQVR